MSNEADNNNNNNNDNIQQQPIIKDNESDIQEELSEPLSPTEVIIDDEPAPAAGHPHVQPGRPPVPHDGRRERRVRYKARNGREAGDAGGKAVGQVHAEHDDDDDNNKHAKDDGRADPHDRGPSGMHAGIGAIREELARLLKDYDDIYDYYYPKRNYELHESIPTEAGRKVPC